MRGTMQKGCYMRGTMQKGVLYEGYYATGGVI